MSTLMERGLSMVRSTAEAVSGGQVVYHAGDDEVTVTAVFGRHLYAVESGDGQFLEHADPDFLIGIAALGVEPKPGHWIELGDEKFEVMSTGAKPCFERVGMLADGTYSQYRIHTKRVTT